MLNRISFALALLGLLLTVHMWIQKQRGFDEGCLGVATQSAESASVSGCEEAMESEFSTFLGLDNVIAGFAFYAVIGGLALSGLFAGAKLGRLLGMAQAALAVVAFCFSAYLVYQLFFVLDSVCPLCLTSAAAVTALLAISVMALRKQPAADNDLAKSVSAGDFGYYALSSFAAGVLLVADLVFVNNIGLADQKGGADMRSVVNQVLEERIDKNYLTMMAPCEIDDSRRLLTDWHGLIDPGDPVMGNPDSPVKVIDIFDPNCPHCKQIHAVLKPVVKKFGDRVAFYYKPYPLWEKSISQVEALWLAADQGRYFEMIELQFQVQQHEGLSEETLVKLLQRTGANETIFEHDLEAHKYRDKVMEFKQRVNAAGITAAPVILLNGKYVGKKGQSMSVDCIGNLIERELQGNGS